MDKNIKNLKAEDIMISPVLCSMAKTSVKVLVERLATTKYYGIPIINEDEKLVGIITEKNILNAVNQGRELATTMAEEIMTSPVVTAIKESMLSAIIKTMMEKDITRVVITENHKVVGIVSQHDIVKNLKKDDFVEM
jgi:CBS domain-containing protein